MLLENDTITISKEAIKKYGALGAVILQELYSVYGDTAPLDVPRWRNDCLEYIPETTIKRVLTELFKDGKISRDDDYLYILVEGKKSKVQKVPPKERANNPLWEMAVTLCTIVGQNKKFQTPERYLKFAKQLLEDNRTIEFMEQRYGKDGWWYKTEYKGQMGSPPTLEDIRKTLDKVAVTPQVASATTSQDDFWTRK